MAGLRDFCHKFDWDDKLDKIQDTTIFVDTPAGKKVVLESDSRIAIFKTTRHDNTASSDWPGLPKTQKCMLKLRILFHLAT